MTAAKKNEVATVTENLPANIGELGSVSENYQGINRLILPVVKCEWQAKLFNMPDGNPVKTFDGIILRVEQSKLFWLQKMSEGGTAGQTPDCAAVSIRGMMQAPFGENVQAESCAKCKHNQFGTATNEKGEKTGGKRCGDKLRFFIFTEGNVLPVQMSIPPTSLFAWSAFVPTLKQHFSAHLVKFSIVPDKKGKAPGVIHFEVARTITEAEVKMVLELRHKFDQTFGAAPVVEDTAPVTDADADDVIRKATAK